MRRWRDAGRFQIRSASKVTLPADLLHAIAHGGGGRVVLVVGAGASCEPPTGLPLSSEAALEAHRHLVADGVLIEGECASPEDLSCLADAVVHATGGQRALVERLPVPRFRSAEPNEGYLIAAALLREQAVGCVMTLNFDLGMSAALTRLGAHEDVGVVSGPEEHHRLGAVNLIYLHRNVYADPDAWILRTSALADAWRDRWEEVIAHRVIGGPVTVFAGLGTPAAVLVETAVRILTAIPDGARVFQVDPGNRADSAFFARLRLPDDAYMQMGWCDFAKELGARVLEEHRNELEQACRALISTEGWADDDPADLCTRLGALGLVGLGQLRARWTLDPAPYTPRRAITVDWLADLLLGVGVIERATGARATFDADGIVELRRDDRVLAPIAVASGRGTKRWLTLETDLNQHTHRRRNREPEPRFVLVSGVVQGSRPSDVAPPGDVAIGDEEANIINGGRGLRLVSVDDIRARPEIAQEMAA